MRNWSQYRHPVAEPIFVVAAMQLISGGLLSWGCLCTEEHRLVGMLVAFGMGAFVVTFALAAYWSRTRPKSAVLTATGTEVLLLLLLGLLLPGEPPSVWYVQLPVALLLLTTIVVAFRRRRHGSA